MALIFVITLKIVTLTTLWTCRSRIRASWYNYKNNQQDALYRLIHYSKSAVHVSGNVFAHHQENLTVFTVSGSVHPSCCRLVPAATWQQHRVAMPTELSRSTVHIVTTVFDSAVEKAQAVTPLISVLEFPCLNFGWQTENTDCGLAVFLRTSRHMQGHFRLRHDHIFSNSLLTMIKSFGPAYSE